MYTPTCSTIMRKVFRFLYILSKSEKNYTGELNNDKQTLEEKECKELWLCDPWGFILYSHALLCN